MPEPDDLRGDNPDVPPDLAVGPQRSSGDPAEGHLILEEMRDRAKGALPKDLVVVFDAATGTARLQGSVEDEIARRALVAIAEAVPGVRRVDDLMVIHRGRS